VKRLSPVLVVVVLTVVALVGVLGWFRMREMSSLTKPHHVHTASGTNYVVQISSATLGRVNNNYLVIVAARVENPNPFEVVLRRDSFVLLDSTREYFSPSTNGTQAALIRLPPGGARERELFTFAVTPDSFNGMLAFMAGHQNFVQIKSAKPYRPQLSEGDFKSFHRLTW